MPVDFNATPADLAAKFLELYADNMDGQFPANLKDALKALAERIKPADPDAPPSEVAMQAAFYGAGLAAVIIRGVQGEDWQYDPAVKRGDSDKIVFWFHDRKKSVYRAVYGDLRVAEVEKDDLPPLQTEATDAP